MRACALDAEAGEAALHDVQTRLTENVNQLRVTWIGQVSDMFYGAYTQFDKEVEEVRRGMEELHSELVGPEITGRGERNARNAVTSPLLDLL